ncbi:MAG: cell division protein FtsZ [Actinobacteria bacterium RBG_16_64_13]|nr:MAG: cell division protein FtsZ [Actinobacteria bacterium RBG_16_64_13]
MKDSGLSSLFRVTETAKPAEDESQTALPVEEEAPGEDQAFATGQTAGEAGAEAAEQVAEPEAGPTTDAGRRTLIPQSSSFPAVIRVVGVGGAGTNAINRMLEAGIAGVEFIAVNTDAQALAMCEADHKLRIGRDLTKGLGGGSDPKVGRDAALAAYDEIKSILKGSDMVFITAGEGGGTGTGAAPVVAEIARSLGALTIGVVSRPFAFEGRRRGLQALEGARALKQRADTVIVVPNDKLLQVADKSTTMVEALRLADDVLRQGVQGICDLVTVPGLINLDLADVRTIMSGAGTAHMGIGHARGEGRGQKAAEMALNSSLLETSIEGARGILLNISGGEDMSLHEITEVAETVSEAAERDANIIFGAVVDKSLGDTLWVTVVATGFDATSEEKLTQQVVDATAHDHSAERHAPVQPAPAVSPVVPKEVRNGRNKPADDELEVPTFLR